MSTQNPKLVMDTNSVVFECLYKIRKVKLFINGRMLIKDLSKRDSRIQLTHDKFSSYRQRGIDIFTTETITNELKKLDHHIKNHLFKYLQGNAPTFIESLLTKSRYEIDTLMQKITHLDTKVPPLLNQQIICDFQSCSHNLSGEEKNEFLRRNKPFFPETSDINIIAECISLISNNKEEIYLLTDDLHFCSETYKKYLRSKSIIVDEIMIP